MFIFDLTYYQNVSPTVLTHGALILIAMFVFLPHSLSKKVSSTVLTHGDRTPITYMVYLFHRNEERLGDRTE